MRSQAKFAVPAKDRRSFGRRQVVLHAMIKARGRSPSACVVLDISDGGARLQVDFPAWLPQRFWLSIDGTGFEADCEIAHRDADSVGVRFVSSRGRIDI